MHINSYLCKRIPFWNILLAFMDIINSLDSVDKSAMLFLNHDMGSCADTIFWVLSSRLIWIPVGLFFLYCVMKKKDTNWKTKALIVFGLALTIALSDQIASSLFKPLVARYRPSHDIEIASMLHYVNNYHGGKYGFMSSHAANAFGAAVLGSKIIRRRAFTIFLFVLAFVVSYSRIYLGVHFLGDVVCGAMVGTLVGYMVYHILVYVHCRFAMFRPDIRPQAAQ